MKYLLLILFLSSCSKCDLVGTPFYEAGHAPEICQKCYQKWNGKFYDNTTDKACEVKP